MLQRSRVVEGALCPNYQWIGANDTIETVFEERQLLRVNFSPLFYFQNMFSELHILFVAAIHGMCIQFLKIIIEWRQSACVCLEFQARFVYFDHAQILSRLYRRSYEGHDDDSFHFHQKTISKYEAERKYLHISGGILHCVSSGMGPPIGIWSGVMSKAVMSSSPPPSSS